MPNFIAHAAGFVPDDPGRSGKRGGWQQDQWNFLAGRRRRRARRVGQRCAPPARPAARGVTIAVLDTGVAYENRGGFRRSPDFARSRFASGYDFVDRDRRPDDENGHGTHRRRDRSPRRRTTASAHRARLRRAIMPVRVLDANGEGDARRSRGASATRCAAARR